MDFLRSKTYHRKKILVFFGLVLVVMIILVGRIFYLMVVDSAYYEKLATELHERERSIKAARGRILDTNGVVLADNKTVCTISVIHSQIEDKELVIDVLCKELGLSEETVRKRVEKVSSIERIKTNVDKETGDRIRSYKLAGVKVDEDFKRTYPFGNLASRVLGFTGSDNQGIIGLEVEYEDYLEGQNGMILTLTDAKGIEIDDAGERRIEAVDGNDLCISLDSNIQQYVQQAAEKVLEQKSADHVSVIVMKPDNGEILAMVNAPEFDLNDPFTLPEGTTATEKNKQDLLNQIWRNPCISDTYEPGSIFKIFTASAAFEAGVVSFEDNFSCPGFAIVEDRKIRCHKVSGHGGETFLQGLMNSCNPVFINVGMRLGVDNFFQYFDKFGLTKKTGVDLPGEAGTIMHKKENVGAVELATMSFGQSFQITPIQVATLVATTINGGNRITPHFGVEVKNHDGEVVKTFSYPVEEGVISEETVEKMRYGLEMVVAEGGGNKAYIPGYRIGGKTATSQTLPRGSGKYIAAFTGFAPAENPEVMVLIVIHHPQGIYYGGTIAAPVAKEIFENILPYLGLVQECTEEEIEEFHMGTFSMPNFLGLEKADADALAKENGFTISYMGGEGKVIDQFPLAGEEIKENSTVILYRADSSS